MGVLPICERSAAALKFTLTTEVDFLVAVLPTGRWTLGVVLVFACNKSRTITAPIFSIGCLSTVGILIISSAAIILVTAIEVYSGGRDRVLRARVERRGPVCNLS